MSPEQRAPGPTDPPPLYRVQDDPTDDRATELALPELANADLEPLDPLPPEPVDYGTAEEPTSTGPEPRTTAPQAAQTAPRMALPRVAPQPVPFMAKVTLYVRMAVAFLAAMTVTFTLIFLPWTTVLSPRLQAAREARIAATQPPPPQVIEVPMPVPVVVEVPTPVPVAPEPEPPPAPVARTRPTPRPKRTPRPVQPAPAPEPVPVVVAAVPEPTPPAPDPKPAPAPPPPETPAAALALEGTYAGSSGGRQVAMTLDFRPEGRVVASLDYGEGEVVQARGTYALQGDRATIALVESGGEGASYAAMVDASGADGRVTAPGGRPRKLKVRR